MARQRIIFVPVLSLSITVLSVQALTQAADIPEFNKKIAESLNIRWRSIEYEKTLYNPAQTSNKQGRPKVENLSISFDVETLNSRLILSTCPDAVIEQITDSRGNNIESEPFSSPSSFVYAHIPRMDGHFVKAGQPVRPEFLALHTSLEAGLSEQIKDQIGLKGYFYALTAESFEYVEMPFQPSDKWVRLTPDVEVRVRKAQNEAYQYQFDIEQRPENVIDLSLVQIGDYLPNRLIVDREFIVKTSSAGAGGGHSTGRIGGEGSGIGRAEKIRYTIAVNPTHQTIPFETKRIPLSEIAEPAPAQTNISNRKGLNPVKRMPEQVKPQFNKEITDCFEVDWKSITYRKILYNPVISGKKRDRRGSETLSVNIEARILDPKMIIGTCDKPVIQQITDGNGRDTDISMAQSRSNRMHYSTLQYQPGLIPTLPSQLIQWEGKARQALRLPLQRRHFPKRTLVLQPIHMGIQLDPGLLRQDTVEISSIKGCFHALTAESSKHIEVPFKPDNKWVRLTSDVEIQVRKAWHTGTVAHFDIRQRERTGASSHDLYVGDSLPDGIVVERQFIGKSSQPIPPIKFGRSLPGSIGGSGRHNSGQRIEKIDYLIAVGLNHNRICFELKHIPLPKP